MKKKVILFLVISVLAIIAVQAVGCSQPSSTTAPSSPSSPSPSASAQNALPVTVVSVIGPLPPLNPGGPNVAVTLKNSSSKPVTSLNASLELNRSFVFNFNVSAASPLASGADVSAKLTLINGGFDGNALYPLTITGTFQDGSSFSFTQQVQIGPVSVPYTGTPVSSPTPSPVTYQNSATVISQNGLSLTVATSAGSYRSGDRISVSINEKNTLAWVNNMPASSAWVIKGLNDGPCGTLNYPFGIAVLQGDFSLDSIASATPLVLYDPNAINSCPMILAGITAYNFQPSSDMAAISTSFNSQPVTMEMSSSLEVSGNWTGAPNAVFTAFTPGVYTLVGGDEWGNVAILHFIVN